jgi:hypothetical protein
MRIVKLAVISFVMFFLLITGISLFIPSNVRISKAINIAAPRDSIWQQIDNFNNWSKWNPFVSDTSVREKIISPDGTAMQIDNTNVKWLDKQENSRTAQMTTSGHRAITSVWNTINYSSADSVTIQWYLDFKLRWYPWEKFSSLMLEKSYGPALEKGLTNLKKQLEN